MSHLKPCGEYIPVGFKVSHNSDYEKYWLWGATLCIPTEVRQRFEATYGIYLHGGRVRQDLPAV
jgi:hypothetical protein